MNFVIALYNSFVAGLAYRFRGGGYFPTGHDTLVRFIWGIAFAMSYACLSHNWSCLWLILAGYLDMVLVPHGFCMNAGQNADPPQIGKPKPSERWPGLWLPQWTVDGWHAAPLWQKEVYDFVQMASVAFFRGIIAFVPLAIINHLLGLPASYSAVLAAVATISLLQPLGYQAGIHWLPKTYEFIADGWWPEFLNGMAWVAALGVFNAL